MMPSGDVNAVPLERGRAAETGSRLRDFLATGLGPPRTEFIRALDALVAEVEALVAEVEQLRAWKADVHNAMDGCNEPDYGTLPQRVEQLRAERDAAVEQLRACVVGLENPKGGGSFEQAN